MDKDEFCKRFGAKIKRLRKERGFSQERLAEEIGKTVEAVSSTERGLTSPRLDTAMLIADSLDVPLYELFMVSDISPVDREKMLLLDNIQALLQHQSLPFIHSAQEQIEHLIAFEERLNSQKK